MICSTIPLVRRLGLKIGVLVVTFAVGVIASGLVNNVFKAQQRIQCSLGPGPRVNVSRFFVVSSLNESDYQIYTYWTPAGGEAQEINLFSNFTSAEMTRDLFESNATTSAADLIERGPKLDVNGHKIGERGITKFTDSNAVRIFWTQGDDFWAVQAPSLELALEFEQSDICQSITRSRSKNHIERTRRQ